MMVHFLTAGRMVPRLLLCLLMGGISIAGYAKEQQLAMAPILSYSEAELALDGVKYERHASAFHTKNTEDEEAKPIVAAWQKNQPITTPWTQFLLGRFVKHKISPSRAARGLALFHVAMHDAMILAPRYKVNDKAATSAAAAAVLEYLFPAEEKAFERIADATLRGDGAASNAQPDSLNLALAMGQMVGKKVAAYGESDGAARGWNGERLQWYGDGRYYGPGTWEPTPPYYYYPPDEPFAPTWRPWILRHAGEFRPTPPAFGSPKYLKDLKEVVEINANQTPEQLKIAKFWVDGKGSVTPPGHWNQIGLELALQGRQSNLKVAEVFAKLNMALADSFIAAWDAKYYYWTVRPITAAKQVLGVDFKPSILTPPFPSYVSGHATFSGAAAQILGAYFPKDAQRLNKMAEEAAMSRLYGGIHFRHDNEDGLVLGRKIAAAVLKRQGHLGN